MQLTISRWGNSLAVRIPADIARQLALAEGAQVECHATEEGVLELIPAGPQARSERMHRHFVQVNQRLAKQAMTTPSAQLLRDEERY